MIVFEVLPTPNLITTVMLSMSLGFILSPIVENLFMIQSTTDIINVNVIGATYIVLFSSVLLEFLHSLVK